MKPATFARALLAPRETAWQVAGRISPDLLFRRYAGLAARQGFTRSWFVLSFDCDTELDFEVAEGVHDRLAKLGISPVYAVPGKLLERGAEVYRRLAARGAEFLNHGHEIHCEYDPVTRTYVSSFFYDRLPSETVLADVRAGHEAVTRIIARPAGFRTPHFGSFQSPAHLDLLWGELTRLGYRYSSSTGPLFGFRKGPMHRAAEGLLEIPVSGRYTDPLRMLDSWSFRFDPARTVGEADYGAQFRRLASWFCRPGGRGLFNVYADPSQVHDWPLFFECMESVAGIAAPSYARLLEELKQ